MVGSIVGHYGIAAAISQMRVVLCIFIAIANVYLVAGGSALIDQVSP
jgi:hypothetical protein